MNDTRLVPMTREQRDAVEWAWDTTFPETHNAIEARLGDILAAWDAAPADPAEAVLRAVAAHWMPTGMGNEERIDEVYDAEGAAIYRASLVLRALGVPNPGDHA